MLLVSAPSSTDTLLRMAVVIRKSASNSWIFRTNLAMDFRTLGVFIMCKISVKAIGSLGFPALQLLHYMSWAADTILWCVNIDENLCFCTCEELEAKFWTAGGSVLSGCPPGVGPWMLWETDGVCVDVIPVGPWMLTMVIISTITLSLRRSPARCF